MIASPTELPLSPEALAAFERDGYLSVWRVSDLEEVARLRRLYDAVLAKEIDMGSDDRMLGGLTRQVMHPSKHHEYFQDNPVQATCQEIARQLLPGEPAPAFTFDMLISKAPRHIHDTPWHQDWAYSQMPFAAEGTPVPLVQLTFWVALDDVDEENSCMQFVPGAQRTLRRHRVISGTADDEGRLLGTENFEPEQVVVCAIPAGGCTIHTEGTLHYTGPNRSHERIRRAYILNFRRLV